MLEDKWCLCVPTYRRKEPEILKMLNLDDTLIIHLFVRHEELESGFYDHLLQRERLYVIDIGSGLSELGETRQRILDWCVDNKFRYCCMFDDGISNVHGTKGFTISEVFNECIRRMRSDVFSQYVVGHTFAKNLTIYEDGSTKKWSRALSGSKYFNTMPAQALIIDINKLLRHNIKYKSLEEVGFEDDAFFADCLKAGLIFVSNANATVDGFPPNAPKKGGSHEFVHSLEKKYDKQCAKYMEYIGNMYGVTIEKRYRSFCDCELALIEFNLPYFRETLCENRNKNLSIIKSKFERSDT